MVRPVLITSDETLLDELLRLAAAAGTTPLVAATPDAVLRAWHDAPAVVLGADQARRAVVDGAPRRPDVQVVGWDGVDPDILRAALEVGAEGVVELPHGEAWLVEWLTDLADAGRAPGAVVGVVGGSGGAGATTLACAIAQVAAADRGAADGACLVVDGDPLGPGVDRVLGMEHLAGVRWDALPDGGGRLGAGSLRDAVPSRGGLGVLTWPHDGTLGRGGDLTAYAAPEVISAGRRGHDLVVVDLPRAAGRLLRDLAARCDRVLVVTTGTVPSVAATVRTVKALGEAGAVSLVVRGRHADPGEVGRVCGLPVSVAMPDQRGLGEAVDLGLGPVRSRRSPLARAAALALDRLHDDLPRHGCSPAAAGAGRSDSRRREAA